MKLMTVLALASGFGAAPLVTAGGVAALPTTCDGIPCVPGVAKNATEGQPCIAATRYPFGVDSSGTTLICAQVGRWVTTSPLVGVRTVTAPCDGVDGTAQSPDGLPLSCNGRAWVMDFDKIFYTPSVG
ncbi:MAG: hypothetical protein WAM92_13760 [Mycobacterium sp.]